MTDSCFFNKTLLAAIAVVLILRDVDRHRRPG